MDFARWLYLNDVIRETVLNFSYTTTGPYYGPTDKQKLAEVLEDTAVACPISEGATVRTLRPVSPFLFELHVSITSLIVINRIMRASRSGRTSCRARSCSSEMSFREIHRVVGAIGNILRKGDKNTFRRTAYVE